MNSGDPWSDLAPPGNADTINAKRIDANLPWGFFWARDADRKCLLVLRHRTDTRSPRRLPKLQGIEILVVAGNDADHSMLTFRLLDSAHRDIFYRLCVDILERASGAPSEQDALDITLSRTWRWHHLLRGGNNGLLSPEEQKGLIGELLVLERHLLPALTPFDAVQAWKGPLGAPKDFEIGRMCIEVKTRRGGAIPFIAITSEHQLDSHGVDSLFLFVCELDQAPSDSTGSFTLPEIASRIRDQITASDNSAGDTFDVLLVAAGLDLDDDYSDWQWIEGTRGLYAVANDFPRIVASQVPTGISNVKYSLSLIECAHFLVSEEMLKNALEGIRHGN